MAVKIIYFVHGTTTDNEEHKATGWLPGELSQKGIEESKALKKHININEIDLVISSDLKRAVNSSNNIFENNKKILHDKRIRECNYGEYNGKSSSYVNYDEHIINSFPNGESLKDVEDRVKDFCNYLLKNYDGYTVALVSHKAPQLALEVILNGKTWEEAIKNDWRKTKSWQPGWTYEIKNL